MTTFTIGDHSANTNSKGDYILPLILGLYSYKEMSEEQASFVYNDVVGSLDDINVDFDTTNKSINTEIELGSDAVTTQNEAIKSKDIEDFNIINEFAGKLLKDQSIEPIEAQKVTYNKFWNLF